MNGYGRRMTHLRDEKITVIQRSTVQLHEHVEIAKLGNFGAIFEFEAIEALVLGGDHPTLHLDEIYWKRRKLFYGTL